VNLTQCIPGKFKPVNGSAPCSGCVRGTYLPSTGAVSNVCQTCPSNSGSQIASANQTDCICNAGSTGADGSNCVKCGAGKYKFQTGSGNCVGCLEGKYSTAVGAISDVCQGCPQDSNAPAASDEKNDCICNAGFTKAASGICTICETGKFKNEAGNGGCSVCIAGKYLGAVGCEDYPENSMSLVESSARTQCTCNSGATGANGGPCSLCLPGTYKQGEGPTPNVCSECVAGKYSTTPNVCSECVAGKYSTTTGAVSSSTCQMCPAASDSSTASSSPSNCKCGIGWIHHDADTYCRQCARDTYTNIVGSEMCIECTLAQYSNPSYGTTAQYSDGENRTNVAQWRMCSVEKIALSTGINTNIHFQLERESPCTVRFLLGSAQNWTIGDSVRMQYGEHTTLNPKVLHFLGTKPGEFGPNPLWSPVNVQPMHRTDSIYTTTVQAGPFLLKLDMYDQLDQTHHKMQGGINL